MPSATLDVPESKWDAFIVGFCGYYPKPATWRGTDREWLVECLKNWARLVYLHGRKNLAKQQAEDAADPDILAE